MPPTDPADDEPTDASLVERIRHGSPEALDPLYRRHGAGVYRFALLWSVSTPMPRMMLAEFGLPVDPARAADSVSSELLVRRDGTVLAVRFID